MLDRMAKAHPYGLLANLAKLSNHYPQTVSVTVKTNENGIPFKDLYKNHTKTEKKSDLISITEKTSEKQTTNIVTDKKEINEKNELNSVTHLNPSGDHSSAGHLVAETEKIDCSTTNTETPKKSSISTILESNQYLECTIRYGKMKITIPKIPSNNRRFANKIASDLILAELYKDQHEIDVETEEIKEINMIDGVDMIKIEEDEEWYQRKKLINDKLMTQNWKKIEANITNSPHLSEETKKSKLETCDKRYNQCYEILDYDKIYKNFDCPYYRVMHNMLTQKMMPLYFNTKIYLIGENDTMKLLSDTFKPSTVRYGGYTRRPFVFNIDNERYQTKDNYQVTIEVLDQKRDQVCVLNHMNNNTTIREAKSECAYKVLHTLINLGHIRAVNRGFLRCKDWEFTYAKSYFPAYKRVHKKKHPTETASDGKKNKKSPAKKSTPKKNVPKKSEEPKQTKPETEPQPKNKKRQKTRRGNRKNKRKEQEVSTTPKVSKKLKPSVSASFEAANSQKKPTSGNSKNKSTQIWKKLEVNKQIIDDPEVVYMPIIIKDGKMVLAETGRHPVIGAGGEELPLVYGSEKPKSQRPKVNKPRRKRNYRGKGQNKSKNNAATVETPKI
jgi:hypothetical protein